MGRPRSLEAGVDLPVEHGVYMTGADLAYRAHPRGVALGGQTSDPGPQVAAPAPADNLHLETASREKAA